MGFNDGEVILNNTNHTYYTGQEVHGVLKFQQDKLKKFRGIFVKLKGFCQVKWTTSSGRKNQRVTHEDYEEYINQKIYLVGTISGECTLGIGFHEYPFSFQLPQNCPSSFEGDHGHIRYHVKVVVDRSMKLDQEKKIPLHVIAPLDLNLNPYCSHPMDIEILSTYCCWCVSSGGCDLQVKAPHSGYTVGQSIPLDINLQNHGTVSVAEIKLTIKEKITFIASDSKTRCKDTVIQKVQKGPVPANTNRNWIIDMPIPNIVVYNVTHCKAIDIQYKFKVTLSPNGFHMDDSKSWPIIIGSLPLLPPPNNMQNPGNQMAMQYNVSQNPMSNLSNNPPAYSDLNLDPNSMPVSIGNSPFPTPNAPYPTAPNLSNPNTPYPTPNVPYPSSDTPYPTSNKSNSAPNPPYPTTNLSNLTTNPPYPTTIPSNLATNPPYPTTNPSNLASNPPYPTTNTSNLVTNPPYPTTNLSNLTTNPPYPTTNPSNLASNPPYPTTNPSNLASNPPYPTTNPSNLAIDPPYPTSTTPYPTTTTPYPTTTTPYPTTNTPYPTSEKSNITPNLHPTSNKSNSAPNPESSNPTTHPPYLTTNSSNTPYQSNNLSSNPYPVNPYKNTQNSPAPSFSSGLKTGRLGFIGQDSASMPLLPPAAMPVPEINSSPNPFAGASAPGPTTP